jgi:hypothetical protein
MFGRLKATALGATVGMSVGAMVGAALGAAVGATVGIEPRWDILPNAFAAAASD